MKKEHEANQVTQMTIHKPSPFDLARIIRAQKDQPQRTVTCVHEDYRRRVRFATLDLNDSERINQILEQLDGLSPETGILEKAIVRDPSIERKASLKLETDINGDIWRIHFDPIYFGNPALKKIIRRQILRKDPTEILLIEDNSTRRKISHEELLEEGKAGGKSFDRFVNDVVSDMLESDKVIVQFP